MKPTFGALRRGVLDAARVVPGGRLVEADHGDALTVWHDVDVVASRLSAAAVTWRAGHLGAAASQLTAQLARQLMTGSVLAATTGVAPVWDARTRLVWQADAVVAAAVPELRIVTGERDDLVTHVVHDRIDLLTPIVAALGAASRLSERVLWSTVVDDVAGGLVRADLVRRDRVRGGDPTETSRTRGDVTTVWDAVRARRPVLPRTPRPWPDTRPARILVRSSCCFLYRTVAGPAWCTGCPLVDDVTAGRR